MKILVTEKNVFMRIQEGKSEEPHVWFVHGFGESGLCFAESFLAPRLKKYSIRIPDFPGFGSSPSLETPHEVDQSARLLKSLIETYSPVNRVVLVAHSLGGIIATKVALKLENKVHCYINVEGNLTQADAFYSGRAAKASDPIRWKEEFVEEIYQLGLRDESYRRYYLSLKVACPMALQAWGRSGVKETGDHLGGDNFLKVNVPKLYIFGKRSTPTMSRAFLKNNKINSLEFPQSGHWPMIEETERFYETVGRFIVDSCRVH